MKEYKHFCYSFADGTKVDIVAADVKNITFYTFDRPQKRWKLQKQIHIKENEKHEGTGIFVK